MPNETPPGPVVNGAIVVKPAKRTKPSLSRMPAGITKENRFEVPLPTGLKASGVVLADQHKSLDWQARGARFYCKLPASTVESVLETVGVLLEP